MYVYVSLFLSPPTLPASLSRIPLEEIRQTLHLRHPQRLIHTFNKMPRPATPLDDTALLEQPPHTTALFRATAEKHPHPAIDVAVDDLLQHLGARTVEAGDAVDVEDDVAVVLGAADAGQGRVGGGGAVEFQPSQPAFEIARVGEGQRFRDLDDQAAVDEFHLVRARFRVFELVRGARDFAQDLDAGLCGVFDD